MKVKQLVPQLNKDTFAYDYFRACGIEDVEEFECCTGKYIQSANLVYRDIDTKVKWFIERIGNIAILGKDIVIVCDSDNDGLCSSALTYYMLTAYGVQKDKIKFLYHSDKTHGLTNEIMEQIREIEPKMVVIPDAGSNNIEQVQKLLDKDICVFILDHHKVDNLKVKGLNELIKNLNFCIVNNQLEETANKHLCGTGVVFKFWQALCQSMSTTDYANCLDLVAMANIADVMDMRDLENVAFNKWGLWYGVQNPFLKALCEHYCKKTNGITPENISWDVAPKLNAVCRSDNQEAKDLVLRAFCGLIEDYNEVIKVIEQCYRKQKNDVKKAFESILNSCDEPLDNEKVIIRFCENTPYTGLIANKLMSHYNKPILLVHKNENGLCMGSGRSPIPIRKQIADCKDIIFAQGHENAFGICWDVHKTTSLMGYLSHLDLDYNAEYSVATILSPSHIPTWLFYETEKYQRCWGEEVQAPRFYIQRVRINSKDIRELGNGTTLKFKYKDIDYLKFFAAKQDKELLSIGTNKPLIIDIIGSLGVNRYNGREYPQVKIDKFEIVEERWESIW